MKKKSELNVFKYGYCYKWTTWKGFWRNISQFFTNIKFAYQRATRGYADWDVWDLDNYYTRLFRDTLTHLADTTHSYPGKGEFTTPESWDKFLRETAQLFDNSIDRSFEEFQIYKNKFEDSYTIVLENRGSSEEVSEEEKVIVNNYLDEDKNIYQLRERNLQEALDRVKEHYHELWD